MRGIFRKILGESKKSGDGIFKKFWEIWVILGKVWGDLGKDFGKFGIKSIKWWSEMWGSFRGKFEEFLVNYYEWNYCDLK